MKRRQYFLKKVKILAIRLRKIGDIVLSIPSIEAIKRLFPDSELHYVVEESYKELVLNHPFVDKVIPIKPKLNLIETYKFAKELSLNDYDILYDFHGGTRASVLSFFVKAKIKVGYVHKIRGKVYDFKVKRKSDKKILHSVENQLNIVRATGYDGEIPEKIVLPKPSENEKKKVISYISHADDKKKIVIHISAGNRFRDWGEDKFERLIELLVDNGYYVILVGGSDALFRGKKFGEIFGEKILNLTGKLNLLEFKYLSEKSDLFFGVDSGPMHIVSSTKTPIVALFGPNIKEISGPWRKKDVYIIERDLPCRPCKQRECPYKFRCLREIKEEEVFLKIKEIVNG